MHGLRQDADRYRDERRDLAESLRFLLLVPEFSRQTFAGMGWCDFGKLLDAAGSRQRRRHGPSARSTASCCRRCGRYAPAAEAAVIANSGSYTLPLFDRPSPEGLARTMAERAVLRAVLGRKIVL